MYTIYEHISPSGKKYIGQTCQRLARRWRNGYGYVRNTYFYRAIEKYGWDNFQHNIICQCETLEEANKVESELIAQFKTNDPQYGYNISGGADGRERVAESTRLLMSQIRKGKFTGANNPNYGRKHTESERAKMSKIQREYFSTHANPRLGATASDETRRKMSISRRNSIKAQQAIKRLNQSKAKRVKCVETDIIYPSTREVERQTGFRQGNIAAACRGVYAQAYGFHWVYV